MNKKYYAKFNSKDTVLRRELARAHAMIILLVVTLMGVLGVMGTVTIELNPLLTSVAIFLLALVGVISLSVILAVTRKRKK